MIYLIDDIDENGIIENIEDCEIIEIEEDNPLCEILKLLCIDE